MKRINTSSVATGIAVTSLFIALGGPAEAASLITGKNVKNSSLTGADVKNNSLTSADVANIRSGDVTDGSLLAKDFANGQVPRGGQGPAGPAGAAGAAGPRGATGPRGPEGPSRYVLVNAAGVIEQQSGGFRIANAYPNSGAGNANGANGNVYIESGDADLTNNGIVATIALQNQVNQDDIGGATGATGNAGANDGPTQTNPEFSGEITATQCALAGIVACAPMDVGVTPNVPTNAKNYFVVSPRLSDGRRTSDASSPTANSTPNRKRFYVIISGPRD